MFVLREDTRLFRKTTMETHRSMLDRRKTWRFRKKSFVY